MSDTRELARKARFSFGTGTFASDVGLALVEEIEYDDWAAIGEKVVRFGEASAWWIGDWLTYGEWRYGEKYRVALEHLELQYDRIRDHAYVASNVPLAVRRADLSWMHHRAVAKLIPADQERWLAQAAENGWSYRELRDELVAELTPGGERAAVLEQLRVTVEPGRLERWQAAAERLGLSVADWAISTLDKEAQRA